MLSKRLTGLIWLVSGVYVAAQECTLSRSIKNLVNGGDTAVVNAVNSLQNLDKMISSGGLVNATIVSATVAQIESATASIDSYGQLDFCDSQHFYEYLVRDGKSPDQSFIQSLTNTLQAAYDSRQSRFASPYTFDEFSAAMVPPTLDFVNTFYRAISCKSTGKYIDNVIPKKFPDHVTLWALLKNYYGVSASRYPKIDRLVKCEVARSLERGLERLESVSDKVSQEVTAGGDSTLDIQHATLLLRSVQDDFAPVGKTTSNRLAKDTNQALKSFSSMLEAYITSPQPLPSLTTISAFEALTGRAQSMLNSIVSPLLDQVKPAVSEIKNELTTTNAMLSATKYLQNVTAQAQQVSLLVGNKDSPAAIESAMNQLSKSLYDAPNYASAFKPAQFKNLLQNTLDDVQSLANAVADEGSPAYGPGTPSAITLSNAGQELVHAGVSSQSTLSVGDTNQALARLLQSQAEIYYQNVTAASNTLASASSTNPSNADAVKAAENDLSALLALAGNFLTANETDTTDVTNAAKAALTALDNATKDVVGTKSPLFGPGTTDAMKLHDAGIQFLHNVSDTQPQLKDQVDETKSTTALLKGPDKEQVAIDRYDQLEKAAAAVRDAANGDSPSNLVAAEKALDSAIANTEDALKDISGPGSTGLVAAAKKAAESVKDAAVAVAANHDPSGGTGSADAKQVMNDGLSLASDMNTTSPDASSDIDQMVIALKSLNSSQSSSTSRKTSQTIPVSSHASSLSTRAVSDSSVVSSHSSQASHHSSSVSTKASSKDVSGSSIVSSHSPQVTHHSSTSVSSHASSASSKAVSDSSVVSSHSSQAPSHSSSVSSHILSATSHVTSTSSHDPLATSHDFSHSASHLSTAATVASVSVTSHFGVSVLKISPSESAAASVAKVHNSSVSAVESPPHFSSTASLHVSTPSAFASAIANSHLASPSSIHATSNKIKPANSTVKGHSISGSTVFSDHSLTAPTGYHSTFSALLSSSALKTNQVSSSSQAAPYVNVSISTRDTAPSTPLATSSTSIHKVTPTASPTHPSSGYTHVESADPKGPSATSVSIVTVASSIIGSNVEPIITTDHIQTLTQKDPSTTTVDCSEVTDPATSGFITGSHGQPDGSVITTGNVVATDQQSGVTETEKVTFTATVDCSDATASTAATIDAPIATQSDRSVEYTASNLGDSHQTASTTATFAPPRGTPDVPTRSGIVGNPSSVSSQAPDHHPYGSTNLQSNGAGTVSLSLIGYFSWLVLLWV